MSNCHNASILSYFLLSCPYILVTPFYQPTPATSTSLYLYTFCLFSHLIQGGLAHREVFDLQRALIGLQLVEDVCHPAWSNWYMILSHSGVQVL